MKPFIINFSKIAKWYLLTLPQEPAPTRRPIILHRRVGALFAPIITTYVQYRRLAAA